MTFDEWWEDFVAEHDDWKYADSAALRRAAFQAGAASRDAYIERLETGLLQVRKALCGDIHNTDDLLDLIASRDAEIAELKDALGYDWDKYKASQMALRECMQMVVEQDAEIAELVAALESVEWTRLGEMPEGNCCCYCGALKKHGHVTGCKVANVLKRTTLAQALAKVRRPTFFEAGRQSVIEGCDDGTIDWRGENEV